MIITENSKSITRTIYYKNTDTDEKFEVQEVYRDGYFILELKEDLADHFPFMAKNGEIKVSNYKIIDHEILSDQGIDTCYSIKNYDKNINHIASVFSNYTKMGMELFSNNPGLQFYTGNMMDKIYPGKNNKEYGTQFGLCLEPQLFPDAINHSNFKSPILRANEKYSSTIIMKFKNDF